MPEDAEIMEPNFHEVKFTDEEAALYGQTLESFITSALALSELDLDDCPMEVKVALSTCFKWGSLMQHLIEVQTAKAGLGMIP